MFRDGEVWKALANPTRRAILDELREGPKTTGDLAEQFEDGLSRFAVMQHLDVLEAAGLVLVRREGRQRYNHLNAVPIQQIHERWVSRFAERDASALLALKRQSERGSGMTEARTITLESEISVKASAERVWKAMTEEQQAWFPASYGQERLKAVVIEPHVGGRSYEDWGDGAGFLYGHVLQWDPPRTLATRGFLRPAITLEQWMTLECEGHETTIKQSTTTFGPITEEMAKSIRSHGDLGLFEDNIRAWVERGERVGA